MVVVEKPNCADSLYLNSRLADRLDELVGGVQAGKRRLNPRGPGRLRGPGACQRPIGDSGSLTQNPFYLCIQLFAAFSHAFVNVALHS